MRRASFPACFLALTSLMLAATAVPTGAQGPAQTPDQLQAEAELKRARQAQSEAQLRSIEERLNANRAARARIEAEIGELRADRARLNAALIEATRRAHESEARAAGIEARLTTLATSEQAIRRSLDARRALIGDVLAALQRMGRKPPPAVIVRPEDVLAAVRASILMGAVVPELRAEAEALAVDLTELVRLRDGMDAERTRIQAEFETLAGERQRLAALVEARRQREQQAGAQAEAERAAGEVISREAAGLRELMERLEREITSATRAADDMRRQAETQTRETRERMAALAFRDPARLQARAPFADLRGRLPKPVAGSQLRGFGVADGAGGQTRGVTFAGRPGAIVAAPADGRVAFAGPFRTFGQMVILQMDSGHTVLLAGLDRVDVQRGQFVLVGEPVGVLGATTAGTALAFGDGAGQPILYVELRKDGQPIDPAPWWITTQADRVRG